MSRFKTKRFILSFSTFFPILLSLVIFVLFKHTRAGPRIFFVLFFFVTALEKTNYQHVFCSVRAEILLGFFVTWRCWKTQKKVCLCNKSCSRTNYGGGEMEPKFEGSESLGNRKRFRFFLVILTPNSKNFRLGGKVFYLLTWDMPAGVEKQKHPLEYPIQATVKKIKYEYCYFEGKIKKKCSIFLRKSLRKLKNLKKIEGKLFDFIEKILKKIEEKFSILF